MAVDGHIPLSIGLFSQAKFCVDVAGEVRELYDEGKHLQAECLVVAAFAVFRLFVRY